MSYNTPNYSEQGSTRMVIGGALDVISGGVLDVESGGSFKIAGTGMTASAAELNVLDGVTAGTVTGGKAVVVDTNKDAASVRRFTASHWFRESATERVVSTITSTAASSGWTAVASYGISELSASNSTGKASSMGFALAHPGVAGVRKIINAAICSTAKPAIVECDAANWIGSATGSTGKTNHRLTFNDAHELVELMSASTVHWLLVANTGSVAVATNLST